MRVEVPHRRLLPSLPTGCVAHSGRGAVLGTGGPRVTRGGEGGGRGGTGKHRGRGQAGGEG